jgi:hypothetical protein
MTILLRRATIKKLKFRRGNVEDFLLIIVDYYYLLAQMNLVKSFSSTPIDIRNDSGHHHKKRSLSLHIEVRS